MNIRKNPLLSSLLIIVAAIALLAGCQSLPSALKQPLADNGELYVYLQPLPQETDRLGFVVAGISAVNDRGEQFPLKLKLQSLKGSDPQLQRFFAYGQLPPGNYTALAFSARNARLRTEEGEAALVITDAGSRSDVSFTINNRKALLINLNFNLRKSLTNEVQFSPVFDAVIPGKPVPGLVGYVSNYADNTLTVFDKQSMQVNGIIATGRGPKGIAFDQRRRRAYVALFDDDMVQVFDISTGDLVNQISLNMGDNPQEIALSPDGRTIVTTNTGTNSISIIDANSLFETGRVSVGDGPTSALIDPSGKRAFVFNTTANTISVVDLARRSVLTTIATEPSPLRGQFNRRGDALYVIQKLSPYLSVVNPASLAVTRHTNVGAGATAIKVDTNTDQIYLAKEQDGRIAVYDPFSFLPGVSIDGPESTSHMAIDGEENNLCVLDGENGSLLFINLVSRKIVGRIDVGEAPCQVSLIGER